MTGENTGEREGDEPVEADDRLSRVVRLGELLRRLNRNLDRYQSLTAPSPADAAAWEADLYAYDDALVSVADLLDVEVPAGAREDLTPEHRSRLEASLAGSGLDVAGEPAPE